MNSKLSKVQQALLEISYPIYPRTGAICHVPLLIIVVILCSVSFTVFFIFFVRYSDNLALPKNKKMDKDALMNLQVPCQPHNSVFLL